MLHYLTTILLLITVGCAKSEEEPCTGPLTYRIIRNPNCTETICPKNETKLIQVIVRCPDRSVHFLLPGIVSTSPLSIVMLETGPSPGKLIVNYTRFLSRKGNIWNSIVLNDVRTSYGVIFHQFCIYPDVNDTATINPSDVPLYCHHMLGQNLIWKLTDNANGTHPINFIYQAVNSSDSSDKLGRVTVNITIPRNESDFAHSNIFSVIPGNCVFFEITVEGVSVTARDRVAPILLPFSQDPLMEDEDFLQTVGRAPNSKETLINLHLAKRSKSKGTAGMNHSLAFMQWPAHCETSTDGVTKQGAYTAPRMHISAGMAAKYKYALPYAIYGDYFNQKNTPDGLNKSAGLRLQAISFGSPRDGFYMSTKFVRWYGILSMGDPGMVPDKGAQSLLAVAVAIPLMIVLMLATWKGVLAYRRREVGRRGGPEEPLLPRHDVDSVTNRSVIRLPGLLCRSRKNANTEEANGSAGHQDAQDTEEEERQISV